MMQNSVSRRSFLRGVAMSAGVLALAACAPAAAPAANQAEAPAAGDSGAAAEAVTLAWWDYMSDSNGAALNTQMGKYQAAFPNVKVERTEIPFADLK